MTTTNAALLKNKGAPVMLAAVEPFVKEHSTPAVDDTGAMTKKVTRSIGWKPTVDEDGEIVSVREWLRFTNGSLSELQQHYGSMENFQAMIEARPNEAVAVAITAMLERDVSDPAVVAEVHARIMPEEFTNYQVVIMAQLAVANGVDPTQAASMIDEGRLAARDQVEAANRAMSEAVTEMRVERIRAEEELAAEVEPELPTETTPSEGDTTSPSSSSGGSESDEPTTSSGD